MNSQKESPFISDGFIWVGSRNKYPANQAEIDQKLGGASAQIMFCGHAHIPRVIETSQKSLIINPGSVGLHAYEDVTPEYHVIESGSHHARYAILEYKNGTWQAELITIDYDYQQAAVQAEKTAVLIGNTASKQGVCPAQKQVDTIEHIISKKEK